MKHFKIKDIFTSFSLFCVLYSLILLYDGKFIWGSYLLMFVILVLDFADGFVARRLGGGNEFGKEFDTLVDYCSCCLAPPMFIYAAYKNYSVPLAVATAFVPFFFGTIRGVVNKIENIKIEKYFVGLPRPITGLIPLAVINSQIITKYSLYYLGTLIILGFCTANLSHVPYIGNDKGKLKFAPRVILYLILTVIILVTGLFIGCFWELLIIILTAYLISPYVVKGTGMERIIAG